MSLYLTYVKPEIIQIGITIRQCIAPLRAIYKYLHVNRIGLLLVRSLWGNTDQTPPCPAGVSAP